MTMTSTKPYLLRAFYEWILDNQLTPYLLVDAETSNTLVPREHVNDGKIVFNITPGIVQNLEMMNPVTQFDARFSGKLQHIFVPTQAILAIYAKENGQGMMFDPNDNEDYGDSAGSISKDSNNKDSSTKKKPHLTIVK